jgi:hypothetical protein
METVSHMVHPPPSYNGFSMDVLVHGEGLNTSDDSEFSFLPPFQSKVKQLHAMWPCKVTLN